MKKWLALMTMALALTGCAYFSSKPLTQTKQENLQSFLIVQDKLYIVGQLHDYQFENDLVSQLDRFLKSSYANQIEDIDVQFVIEKSPVVEGEYKVYLSGDKLKPNDRVKLKAEFGFNDASSNMMYRSYKANGKVVQLTNRNEVLQRYRFKRPLEAKVIYYEFDSTSDEKMETALGIAALPITIPMAVVGAVILVPLLLVGCATSQCIDH